MKYKVTDKKAYVGVLFMAIIPTVILIVGLVLVLVSVLQKQSQTPDMENIDHFLELLEENKQQKETNFTMLIPGIMLMGFGLLADLMILLVSLLARKYYKRHLFALSGTKRMGKVVACYNSSRNHSGSVSIAVEVEYKTDSNKTATLIQYINASSQYLFSLGKSVPVYVKDEYGYVNIEELKRQEAIGE